MSQLIGGSNNQMRQHGTTIKLLIVEQREKQISLGNLTIIGLSNVCPCVRNEAVQSHLSPIQLLLKTFTNIIGKSSKRIHAGQSDACD
jgi:hypothetical protein